MSEAPVLAGRSKVMRDLNEQICLLAPTTESICLVGETGTGKGVAARRIHALSGRKGRFIDVNAVRLRSSLVEATLFGFAEGAFTGANRAQKGRYEQAHDGTFFLNEGARLKRKAQGLLLELLDARAYAPIGDTREIAPDVRLIFGTSIPPVKLLEDGVLDEHLFYRLGPLYLVLPPLRERKEDIHDLVGVFRRTAMNNTEHASWPDESMQHLLDYSWPGNVRQLDKFVRACHAIAGSGSVSPDIVVELLSRQPANLKSCSSDMGDRIVSALKAFRGIIARTARHLSISENTVRRHLKKMGVDAKQFRAA